MSETTRRGFLKLAATGMSGAVASAAFALPASASGSATGQGKHLQVWSCGGLAEAMLPAHQEFTASTGVDIAYTGAFAAALGKSLLASGSTEVFAGRVLDLAKKLRAAGRMQYFVPLCFTSYVMVTPKGNPAGIATVQDMARPGVRVAMAPEASPPGGQAVTGLLKKAALLEAVMRNVAHPGTCVQTAVTDVVDGKADVMIVELRVARLPETAGKLDVFSIPDSLFPPGPLTFTLGLMQEAKDRALAEAYMAFMTSDAGQAHFSRSGFIPAKSDKGRELVEKLGVKDV